MSAYLIANLNMKDVATYEEYEAKVPALIRKHGGEDVARGERVVVLERGDWNPSRMVLLRFPDMTSVQNLFDDPEYQALKALRQRVSQGDIVVVEGL